MIRPSHYAFVFAAVLPCLASAQVATGPDPDGLGVAPYQFAGHYRLRTATGELTEEPLVVEPPEGSSCSIAIINVFANIDQSGLYYTSGPTHGWGSNQVAEWISWGNITRSTLSDIVPEFTFGYATRVLDPSLGGPGATIEIRFYEAYQGPCTVGGSGVNEVASFLLTGLPASLDPGGLFAYGYFLTLDLRGGDEFEIGQTTFGIGYLNPNDEPTGVIVSFAGSPPGSTTNPDSNGQVTAIDQWLPDARTGLCDGPLTLFNDSSGVLVGTHYLLLRKANAPATPPATAAVRNDSGNLNPIALLPGGTPVLSKNFSLVAAATGPGEVGVILAAFAGTAELATPFGVLLIDITHPQGELLSPSGLAGPHPYINGFTAVTATLPLDVTLCGFSFSVQAMEFGTGLRLTNAVDLTAGFW